MEIGLPAILGAASSAITGIASFMSAQSNAAIMEMNAQVADENSRRAIERAQVSQQDQDIQTRFLLGEQAAAQAASGIDVGTGSSKFARVSARQLGRLDALKVRQSGELESYNFKVDAASGRAQAQAERTGGALGLLGSFLETGGAITSKLKQPRRNFYPVPTQRPQVLV